MFFAVRRTTRTTAASWTSLRRETRREVEFSADFFVIRPKDGARQRHAPVEVPNRRRKGFSG